MGLGINSIPTLMLFKDGQLVERTVGARPKEDIRRMIESHL